MKIELIYCAGGNRRFAQIAIEAGFTYGAQLPNTVYFPPEFADQKWRSPNFAKYLDAIKEHCPRIATVLDWEYREQLAEVLMWSEEIALYVETVIIIPKIREGIAQLPREIGGKEIRLGYSVPTSHGGTTVPSSEFLDWPVHLLGGSPMGQAQIAGLFNKGPQLFSNIPALNIVSVDGNYHQKMATRHNQFCVPDGSVRYAKNRFWPTLREVNGGQNWGNGSGTADAPYEAFRRSCENIIDMWRK